MIESKIRSDIEKLKRPSIIAISGFGGSGKSTFANIIAREIGGTIMGVDHFFTSTTNNGYSNWEIVDFARLKREIIAPFLAMENPLHFSPFDWEHNRVGEATDLPVNDLLILEGVGIFRTELLGFFSYKIWIDCPLEIAIERGKRRDKEDYGVDQDHFWNGIWRDNDQQYWDKYAPKEKADIIVSTHPYS